MNIILANLYSYPRIGGVENSLLFIAKELIKRKHNVLIFSLDLDGKNKMTKHDGIDFFKSSFLNSRFPNVRYSRIIETTKTELSFLIHRFKPDEIWVRNPAVALGCMKSGFGGRIVQIYSTVSNLNADGICLNNPHFPFRKRLIFKLIWPLWFYTLYSIERKILKNTIGFVFSRMMENEFKKIHGKKADSLNITNPGVDINFFSNSNTIHVKKSGFLNYKFLQKKYILYVGRLNTAKNISILIRAMLEIPNDINLLLVGEGEDEIFLKNYARNIGVNSRVFCLGKQNELLPALYTNALVLVLPSLIESFGQTYLEALACGTPIIGFGKNSKFKTATDEIIKDGITGKIVSQYHYKALAHAVNYIISLDHKDYMQMSQNCIRDAKERYSWSLMVTNILSTDS